MKNKFSNQRSHYLSRTLSILLISSFLFSCQSFKTLEYKDYKNVHLNKANFSKVTLSMDLLYHNPNNFGVELKDADLDVYLNDNFLGHSTQHYQIKVPRKNDFSFPLQIDLDTKNLLKNGLTSLFNKEVSIRCTGKLKVGKAKIFKTIPFEYTTKQQISLF